MTVLRTALVALALLGAASVTPVAAIEPPGPLVDTAWLVQHREQVVLLDVRKDTKSYTETGHIPGAILVPWSKVRADRKEGGVVYEKMLPEAAHFEALMQGLGVDRDSTVVVASKGKTAGHFSYAARLYWQLKYFGHDRVALLDGGTAQWAAEKRKLSRKASPARTGDFKVSARREALLAATEEVAAAVEARTTQLVDARPLAFYLGLEQRKYVYAAGHIPGAKSVPFTLLTPMKGPGVLRGADDLKASLRALGVDPEKPAMVYCNSGHVAAGVWFVLHAVLGNEKARLYDGSMHAWTKDAGRPVVTLRVE